MPSIGRAVGFPYLFVSHVWMCCDLFHRVTVLTIPGSGRAAYRCHADNSVLGLCRWVSRGAIRRLLPVAACKLSCCCYRRRVALIGLPPLKPRWAARAAPLIFIVTNAFLHSLICRPILGEELHAARCHRRRSSVNKVILARKYIYEKLTKCPNFTILPEKYFSRFFLGGGHVHPLSPLPLLLRLRTVLSTFHILNPYRV